MSKSVCSRGLAILVAFVAIACEPAGSCVRESDCTSGLACRAGHCVVVADAGSDAQVDAGSDGGRDAGSDAGHDGGVDADVHDTGVDAGSDTGSDADVDAGRDAG